MQSSPQPLRFACRARGFTLLELSIAIAIISVMLGGAVAMFTAYTAHTLRTSTEDRMKEIEKALLDYRRANDRLPCPADITLAISSANYGVEAETEGTCTGGTPAANFSSGNSVAGMIPTKTLRLPDDYAFDSWGRRIMYAVDKRFTQASGFITYGIGTTGSVILVNMPGDGAVIYALLSAGENGHGAYPRNGGSTRVNANITNVNELENCDCTSAAVSGGFDAKFTPGSYYQNSADARDSFDDIMHFKERKELLGWEDID